MLRRDPSPAAFDPLCRAKRGVLVGTVVALVLIGPAVICLMRWDSRWATIWVSALLVLLPVAAGYLAVRRGGN